MDRTEFNMTVPSTNGAKPGRNLRDFNNTPAPHSHYFPINQNQVVFHSDKPHLGESIFTVNNSATVLLRRHGAMSSSSRSPWHPVCSATLRFTCNGSRWIAHGDMADPLSRIARWMRSLDTGDTVSMLASAAPVEWPMTVMRSGSPLNAGTFSRSQCRPATRSIRPKFPWALAFEPVFRKPSFENKTTTTKRVTNK